MESRDPRFTYYGAVALSAFLWGFVGLLVRWVDLPGQEIVIVFWRELFGAGALLLLLVGMRRLDLLKVPSQRGLLLLSSVALAVHWTLLFKAFDLLQISEAVFLVYTAPIFVALLAPLLLHERLEGRTIVALGVSLVGMALISLTGRPADGPSINMTGVASALVAAVLFAFLMIMVKKMRETLPALTISAYGIIVGSLLLLPFTLASDYHVSGKGWASLAVLGVVLVAFAGTIYLFGAKEVKAQHLGILAYIEPVSATFIAALLLDERPGWGDVLGGLLILGAGALVVFRRGRVVQPSDRIA
jgi:drug/metabolite transporter (DMT)-like permease